MQKWLCAALLSMFLALPLRAETSDPIDILRDFDALIDQHGALGMDALMSRALQDARTQGALAPEWSQVMVVTAVLIVSGLGKYERAMALLDEARALAETTGFEQGRIMALQYRAYVKARYGLTEAAAADIALTGQSAETLFDPETLSDFETSMRQTGGVAQSIGLARNDTLLGEATTFLQEGNLDEARSFLLGLRLPEYLAGEKTVRQFNLAVSSLLGFVETLRQSPDAQRHYDQLVADMTAPGSNPPAIRPDLIETPDDVALILDMAQTLVDVDKANAFPQRTALARKWISDLAEQDPRARERHLSLAITNARAAAEWAQAAQYLVELLELPSLDAESRAMKRAELAELRAYAALADGEEIDPSELSDAFGALYAEPTTQPINRFLSASLIVEALQEGRHPYLASLAGTQIYREFMALLRSRVQSGETMAAQSAFFRRSTEVTMLAAFQTTLTPPEGHPLAKGVCQMMLGVEVCTLVVQTPAH